MKIRSFMTILGLLAVSAFVASAADVSGKWMSSMQGRNGKTRETTFTFKVDGDKLTGTVSGRGGDRQIADGKVSGDEISFTVTFEMGDSTVKQMYKGTVSGDEIKGTIQREGAENSRPWTAKRAN
jgi:hypothetical protein